MYCETDIYQPLSPCDYRLDCRAKRGLIFRMAALCVTLHLLFASLGKTDHEYMVVIGRDTGQDEQRDHEGIVAARALSKQAFAARNASYDRYASPLRSVKTRRQLHWKRWAIPKNYQVSRRYHLAIT